MQQGSDALTSRWLSRTNSGEEDSRNAGPMADPGHPGTTKELRKEKHERYSLNARRLKELFLTATQIFKRIAHCEHQGAK